MLLDGQGMDEAWAGYDYYFNQSGSVIQGVSTSPVRPEVLVDSFRVHAEKTVILNPLLLNCKTCNIATCFIQKFLVLFDLMIVSVCCMEQN